MVTIKNAEEIKILKISGKKLALVMKALIKEAKPGITAEDLDKLANKLILNYGGKPSFLNYKPDFSSRPFPKTLCVSLNEVIVHGVPSKEMILKKNDMVSLDLGMEYQGLFTDMAATFYLGFPPPLYKKMIQTTKKALLLAAEKAKEGNTLGDIGYVIESCVKKNGFAVIKDLVGHGVGYAPHEDPIVSNCGKPGSGLELKAGMVLAIEPMLTILNGAIKENSDASFSTLNGKVSCHFEHTVVVGKSKGIIVTS